ncbi:MAG TPA: LPS export ABC transporter permease LptF [Gammaproteobacteria bacterium]|nr:LPS export ABC transporter permease LptF [Gammaproteobacteria bacterium]
MHKLLPQQPREVLNSPIISGALIREVLFTSGGVSLIILSIFLVVRLVSFLQLAASGDIPVNAVMLLLALKLVTNLDAILPMMIYVAMLMVLARWNRDNEMVVLSACGFGPWQLLRPMSVLALISVLLIGLFSTYLSPLSIRVSAQILREYRSRSEISGIIPGVFTETRNGQGVYYVESFDKKRDRYLNVFIYDASPDRDGVVVARFAHKEFDPISGDSFLVLENGTRYEGNPGDVRYRVISFERYAYRLPHQQTYRAVVPIKGMPTWQVLQSDKPRLVLEWHWRISKPFSMLVLVLFALTFSFVDGRKSRMPSLFLAIGMYFVYANAIGFVTASIKSGAHLPAYLLWLIHALFLLLAIVMFHRRSRNRPLLPDLGQLFSRPRPVL